MRAWTKVNRIQGKCRTTIVDEDGRGWGRSWGGHEQTWSWEEAEGGEDGQRRGQGWPDLLTGAAGNEYCQGGERSGPWVRAAVGEGGRG